MRRIMFLAMLFSFSLIGIVAAIASVRPEP